MLLPLTLFVAANRTISKVIGLACRQTKMHPQALYHGRLLLINMKSGHIPRTWQGIFLRLIDHPVFFITTLYYHPADEEGVRREASLFLLYYYYCFIIIIIIIIMMLFYFFFYYFFFLPLLAGLAASLYLFNSTNLKIKNY